MSENLDSSLEFDSRLENPSNILIGLDLSADNAEAKVATFDFDYYTHFSDLGLDLEARFTNVSQTATWLFRKSTVRLSANSFLEIDITDSSIVYSNKASLLSEGEIALIKNDDGSV